MPKLFYIMPEALSVLNDSKPTYTPMTNHKTELHTVPVVLLDDALSGSGFIGIKNACVYTNGTGEVFVDFMMLNVKDISFMYLSCYDESSSHCLFQLKSGQEIQGESEQMADIIRLSRGV